MYENTSIKLILHVLQPEQLYVDCSAFSESAITNITNSEPTHKVAGVPLPANEIIRVTTGNGADAVLDVSLIGIPPIKVRTSLTEVFFATA